MMAQIVKESSSGNSEKAVMVQIKVPHPMKLDADQYVNLWLPTVAWPSWMLTIRQILTISIFVKSGEIMAYRKHQRAFVY